MNNASLLSFAVTNDKGSCDDNEEDEGDSRCCHCVSEAQWFSLSRMCWTWRSNCFSVERKDPEGRKINNKSLGEGGGRWATWRTPFKYCRSISQQKSSQGTSHSKAKTWQRYEEKPTNAPGQHYDSGEEMRGGKVTEQIGKSKARVNWAPRYVLLAEFRLGAPQQTQTKYKAVSV